MLDSVLWFLVPSSKLYDSMCGLSQLLSLLLFFLAFSCCFVLHLTFEGLSLRPTNEPAFHCLFVCQSFMEYCPQCSHQEWTWDVSKYHPGANVCELSVCIPMMWECRRHTTNHSGLPYGELCLLPEGLGKQGLDAIHQPRLSGKASKVIPHLTHSRSSLLPTLRERSPKGNGIFFFVKVA